MQKAPIGSEKLIENSLIILREDFGALGGPDIFVVLGAEKKDRRSWTIWEEGGKYPNVVIELLSDSTASIDRSEKKTLYQDV